ncbi:helix-turn-helix domain-containing protein [Rummeliibacillus stabekisii]|uniref:HTH cro/C1-type domain-containing protein n=1 Tax=Rummeliibacillus stabekisii TaxID=241244 RepID=A0A143HEG3_9BACL|nr:helix-turn-helix domain-containing protein [Rummeliibacillus stabekisii]AMX00149.1 hypothetical protein ATY39_12415 [Rummeliibacillus stabekisii]
MPWALLGNEIKKVRTSRKISQIRLAEGICHQSEISRIESGKTIPNTDILYGISKKLNINIDYWLKLIISEESKEQKRIRTNLEVITESKNYEELYEIAEKELHNNNYDDEFRQYLLWKRHIAAFELGKINFEEFNKNLNEILKTNYVNTEFHQEIHILNSLAISNAKFGKKEIAIQYFQQILNMEHQDDSSEIYSKVNYNYSKLLFDMEDYDLALEVSNRAIERTLQQKSMILLGQLFYQRAECKEKLAFPYYSIAEDFENALFIFKLQGLQVYVNILIEKKSAYLKLSDLQLN